MAKLVEDQLMSIVRNLHMFKYLIKVNHWTVPLDSFSIVISDYHHRKFKKKVQNLYSIYQTQQTLNKHGNSVLMELFY